MRAQSSRSLPFEPYADRRAMGLAGHGIYLMWHRFLPMSAFPKYGHQLHI
jgi:hypothetical protein